MNQFFSILPHPDERSAAQLRPTKKKDGIYRLHREPRDTEVLYVEPDGASYTLEWFEAEATIKRLFDYHEAQVNVIMDRLWSFHHIEFDAAEPDIVRTMR
jgi:predicted RNA methylase